MKKETYTITLTRRELLDIRMALVHARVDANDGGGQFMAIREKIIDQMKEQEK